jgi:nucleoside-diphosphate-sugar epimerase
VILVTGATGLVGKALCAALIATYGVRIAVRNTETESQADGLDVVRGELSATADWSAAMDRVAAVVHCAARRHVTKDHFADPLAEFRRINVEGSLQLARQAAAASVKRFVFLSSIKVNGEQTVPGRPFTADQTPSPADPYGVSKMEAETALRALARETGMEVVIIRPPLVYGPAVTGVFLTMIRALWRGIPLPLGAVTANRRSLVALDNLVDLIVTCIDHPAAANQTFLVSDAEDLSTAALLRRMGQALGRPARLLPVPVGVLRLAATLLGRPGIAQRLCGSLEVDIDKTRHLLGWSPPLSVDEGLRRTAAHWMTAQQSSRR